LYKLAWDLDTRGILLTEENINNIFPPRPVFYEELDLLGFDKFWQYPKVEEPLLWAIGRRYYYEGKLVGEASGGGIFESPQIKVTKEGENLTIKPVDIKKMVTKNQEFLNILINEAIDFIADVYDKYKKKVDQFVVSYSGGKDSQVVLDLVSRTLSPNDYIVVFTDTTMELPTTYDVFEKTKEFYQKIYPSLKFYVARNEKPASELWEIFGPPSRIMRWCCSVYKTAPVVRLIRSLNSDKKRTKILVFDGVRADESSARNSYTRVAEEMKHISVFNSRIIMYWSLSEIFLYIYARSIVDIKGQYLFNKGYRYGLNRVGCSICPFASEWSEFIIKKKFPKIVYKYVKILEKFIKTSEIIEDCKVKDYIGFGHWKKRAGGKIISTNLKLNILSKEPNLKAYIKSNEGQLNKFNWLNLFNNTIQKNNENEIHGSIEINGKTFNFFAERKLDDRFYIECQSIDKISFSLFRKIFNKIAFCVNCGVCEAECPTGALKVIPEIRINKSICIECHNCLNVNSYGCILAKSLNFREKGEIKMKGQGIDRYSTFGFRKEWLKAFFDQYETWLETNTLGPVQRKAFNVWLKEAEIIEKNIKGRIVITELGNILREIFYKDEILVWQIIWINLYYNSNIIKWYLNTFDWGISINKDELLEKLQESYPNLTEKTIKNPLSALIECLYKNDTWGKYLKLGIYEKVNNNKIIKKIGTTELSPFSVLYLLYRYANNNRKYRLTLSELYEKEKIGTPFIIFGISKDNLKNILIWLHDNKKDLIQFDCKAGLDNINLIEKIQDYSLVLKYYNGNK